MRMTENQLKRFIFEATKRVLLEMGPFEPTQTINPIQTAANTVNTMHPNWMPQNNTPKAAPAAQPQQTAQPAAQTQQTTQPAAQQQTNSLAAIANDKSQWPKDGKSAARLASQYQNNPKKGAGWLANMRTLTNNNEFLQSVRGLVNQYYGKGNTGAAKTNTGTPAANNAAANNTAANSKPQQKGSWVNVAKLGQQDLQTYLSLIHQAMKSGDWSQLETWKKNRPNFVTSNQDAPNLEKMNNAERQKRLNYLHQSRRQKDQGYKEAYWFAYKYGKAPKGYTFNQNGYLIKQSPVQNTSGYSSIQ